jgi:hypothetical protein
MSDLYDPALHDDIFKPPEPVSEEEALAKILPTPEQALKELDDIKFKAQGALDPSMTLDGAYWDKHFSQGATGWILNKFGQGAVHGFGQQELGLSEKTVKEMRDLGIFNDFEKGQTSVVKTINESVMRPLALGLDVGWRGVNAMLGGVGAVVPPFQAAMEAFPAGHFTGFPVTLPPRVVNTLNDASELGLLPAQEVARRTPFAPSSEVPEPFLPPAPELTTVPRDVHELVRMNNPDLFGKYDQLHEQKAALTDWIDEAAKERDAPAQARIDDILGKVNGVEDRLTKRAALRLELARKELDEIQSVDTPAMAAARNARQDLDFQLRDIAPDVSEAYRKGNEQMPLPAFEEPAAAEVHPYSQEAAEVAPLGEVANTNEAPNVVNLAQRGPTIRMQVARALEAAGRPRAEAQMGAIWWQAYYDTRAARLDMTAQQLFNEDAPRIVGRAGSPDAPGKLTFANPRNIISLFENADASTFLHESAHQWLTDLMKDAERPQAKDDLRADVETLKAWFKDAGVRKSQEMFARGMEQYLMEGHAPSPKLRRVFETFKDWLTQIYKTFEGIPGRVKINDDIRGVYDRLLSQPREEPIIAPERVGAESFDESHMRSARETPIDEAEVRSYEIRDERDRVGLLLNDEVNRVRRETRRGPQRVRVSEEPKPSGEPAGAGEGVAAANEPVNPSGNISVGKSEVGPSGLIEGQTALVDKAGNIRVENLNTPEDVSNAIREAAAANGGFVDARRGVISDAQVLNLADDLNMDPKKINRRKVGETFNAEEIVAARKLLGESATAVRDAAAEAVGGDPKKLIEYGKARERLLMVQGQVSGITAEAGRALRAFRDLGDFGQGGFIAQLAQKGPINELFQRQARTLTELQQEAQAVNLLDDPKTINKFVRDAKAPQWKDYLFELLYSAWLSGYKTQLANIAGNLTVMFYSPVETLGAATLGAIKGTHAVEFAEAADRLAGIWQGMPEAFLAAGRMLADESLIEAAEHTQEARRFNVIPGKLGGAIRIGPRLLASEDEWFKAEAFRQEINVQARVKARLEGLTGDKFNVRMQQLIADPTDDMIALGKKHAAYQTFTNSLGPTGRSIQAFANSHVVAKFIAPFIRTPVNIAKYAGERSPLGFFMKEARENLSGRNGQAAVDTQQARILMGTTVMGAAAYFAWNGLITDGGPIDNNQQNTLRQTGWQPYASAIGGTFIPFNRLDPISINIGLAADMAMAVKHAVATDDELAKVAATLVVNAGKNLFQKTSLRGITSLVQAIIDPQRYGESYMENLPLPVPWLNFFAQVARDMDPEMREVHGIVESWRSKILHWREDLFPKRDIAGQPLPNSFSGWTQTSQDPVWHEMSRLGIGKAPVEKKLGGVELTEAQHDEYAKMAGEAGKAFVDQFVNSSAYNAAPDGIKKKIIEQLWDKGRAIGRDKIEAQSLHTDNDIKAKQVELLKKKLQ